MNSIRTRTLRHLILVAIACLAMLVLAGPAAAVTLSPTTSPLPGSNFQGADGNQDNPLADVGGGTPAGTPDGVTDVDWQTYANTPGAIDTTSPDFAFSGGDKESEPGNWSFASEGTGVNPSKDNLLGAWSTSKPNASGPPNTFLYLAFTREASTGNTFLTFELNQNAQSWTNPMHAQIACRTTGDLLISYEVPSGSATTIGITVYRWIADTSDSVTGCSLTGHFQAIDPQPNAQGAINQTAITNYLSTDSFGNSFLKGTWGEAALNLTGILSGANLNPCESFGQISMHTRSSTSIDSQLQDYISPVPVIVRSCSLQIQKTGSTPKHDNDPETFTYQVTNDGNTPVTVSKAADTGVVDDKCSQVTYVSGDTNDDGKVDTNETWTFTCAYTVNHQDENAGGDIVNTATVYGSVGDTPVTRSTTYTTHVIHPAIEVTKTATEPAVHVGDTIHYTVTVENTGDTSLTVSPADTGCDSFDSTSFTLAAGATQVLDCTHVATADDGASYYNQACAQGVDVLGGPAGTVSDCGDVTTPILHPAITVAKSADVAAVHVGDTINYTIVVTNSGDTDLTVTPADLGCTGFDTGAFSLAPDTSKTLTCSHEAGADDGGSYLNQACAQGVDSVGGEAGTVSDCDSVTTDVIHPAIKIDKTQKIDGGNADYGDGRISAMAGDKIDYRMVVTNPGDTPLDVSFTDAKCDAGTLSGPSGDTNEDGKLDPNETWTYTCSHVMTTADAPDYTNLAHVDGTDKLGTTVSDQDSVVAGLGDSSVSGVKFHDLNGNGTRDAGEGGLSGWTFYVDYNANGQLDAGEPAGQSGSDGSYTINGVKPGSYAVREVGKDGWTCSAPGSCEYDLTFQAGDAKTGADFGNWEPASIAGSKFQDTNNNGAQDAGEGPLSGFTFYVDYNGNGSLDVGEPSAVSGADGTYTITGVKPGTFKVLEVAEPNFTCTFPGKGAACAYDVTVAAGDAQTGKQFGNAPPAQIVLPSRSGTAKLLGPTGCLSRAFLARIRGTQIQSVRFILDGKTVKVVNKPRTVGLYIVRIDPTKLKIGVHRLVASVTFNKASGTPPRKLRLSFQRCAKKIASVRFTG